MQDQWASAVSQRVWSKPVDMRQDREVLFDPRVEGEEEEAGCWKSFTIRGHRYSKYFKMKPC